MSRSTAVLLAVFVFAASCSGGSSDEPSSSPTTVPTSITTEAPRAAGPPADPVDPADVVLHNGTVFTANAEQVTAEAIAIVGDDTETLDLDGRFVMPGVIDAHTHPGLFAILGTEETNQIPDGSLEDIQAWLADLAANTDDLILSGASWPNTLFGPEGPRKEWLDEVVSDRPVVLYDESGHTQWVNSVTLNLLGIDANTPDPSPGLSEFERDADGEPTGFIREFALVPAAGELFLEEAIVLNALVKESVDGLAANGVTTLMDAGNLLFHDEIYSYLAELEASGELPLRYEGSYHIIVPEQAEEAIAEVNRLRSDYGGDRLTFNTIKVHLDGVLEIGTASVLDPYEIADAGNGAELLSQERVTQLLLDMELEEMQLHVHTVGDRAVRTMLDAVDAARAEVGGPLQTQVTLSHIELIHPDDVARFAELDVIANYTPHWHGEYGETPSSSHRFIGDERDANKHPASVLEAAGVTVTYSSDVIDAREFDRISPFFGMQIGISHQDPQAGENAPVIDTRHVPLSIEQLMLGYTINGAQQLQREDELGSIEVGKFADLIVLDHDIASIDPSALGDTEPVGIMIAGEWTEVPS